MSEYIKVRIEDLKVREDSLKQELEELKYHDNYIKKRNGELENLRSHIRQETEDVNKHEDCVKKKREDIQEELENIKPKMQMMERALSSGVPQFKLVLMGNDGVGKSTFLKRFVKGAMKKEKIEGVDCEIYPMLFFTNRGPIHFNIWEISNQDSLTRQQCYVQTQCAILMFDVNSPFSYSKIPEWYEDLTKPLHRKKIPIALVGNKMDRLTCHEWINGLTFHGKKKMPFYKLSANEIVNPHEVAKPFLWLARQLVGDNSLDFVEVP